jgi:hypothetical protein
MLLSPFFSLAIIKDRSGNRDSFRVLAEENGEEIVLLERDRGRR